MEPIMRKTLAIAGASAVIIGGAGAGAAVAVSGTSTPAPSASPSSSASPSPGSGSTAKTGKSATNRSRTDKPKTVNRLRGALHATWVSENKRTRTFTTHEAIRGQVTAVSATSITVKAADSVTETYVLNSSTKVRSRAKQAAGSISDIKTGDPVLVAGTGTTTLTATRVVNARK